MLPVAYWVEVQEGHYNPVNAAEYVEKILNLAAYETICKDGASIAFKPFGRWVEFEAFIKNVAILLKIRVEAFIE